MPPISEAFRGSGGIEKSYISTKETKVSTLRGPAQLADLQRALCVPPITLQVPPTTQLANISNDPKFVELPADVLKNILRSIFIKYQHQPLYIVEKHYIYLKQKNRAPPIKKKLTHIVYYEYQQRSLQR